MVSPSASCTDSTDTRPIAPGQLPNTTRVLRQADGTAWVVYDGVHRFHIQTGGEFMCWVSAQTKYNIRYYVYDQVTQAQVEQFSVDPAVANVSNCGDPSNPTF
jgi:hypothetical protein